jgi:hypothetical protein
VLIQAQSLAPHLNHGHFQPKERWLSSVFSSTQDQLQYLTYGSIQMVPAYNEILTLAKKDAIARHIF